MNRDELNERVCQALQEIGVMIDDGDRKTMRDVGLTPAHFNLLRRLDPGPDPAGYTVTRLAELTLCTRGNVTRLVRRLVEAGLVEIRSDRSDQRLVRVYLSPAGAERLVAAERGHLALNAARFGGLGDAETVDLLDRLTTLAQQLRKHLAQP